MNPRLIIILTTLLMLAGISVNAQNSNQTSSISSIIGDLNGDNKVNAADVVILVDHIQNRSDEDKVTRMAGSLFAKEDINLDGEVNNADVNALVSQIVTEVEFAIVDLRNDIDYADALLLSSNGYYALYDEENNNGYTVLHLNEISKEITDGITFYIDEEGNPVMATMPGGSLLFRNVTESSFNFAFIDNQMNVSVFENINYDDPLKRYYIALTRGFLNPSKAKIRLFDDHEIKYLLPFAMKIAGFGLLALTAAAAVTGAIAAGTVTAPLILISAAFIATGFSEWIKSYKENWKNATIYLDIASAILSGKFNTVPEIVQSAIGFSSGYVGDLELNDINEITPYIDPLYTSDEWQIKLSTNSLECPPEEKEYDVMVESKALWEIDDKLLDESWCHVTKEKDKVKVHVNKYDGVYDRYCDLYIYISNSNKQKYQRLSIKQSGYKFDLSKDEIVFYDKHLNDEIKINTYNVRKWEITQISPWCHVDKKESTLNSDGFSVDVEPSIYDRDGEIKVTAYITGGGWIDKIIKVRQEGCKYNLSKREIVFNPLHLSETVNWDLSGLSYDITNCPDWCRTKPSNNLGFTITVDQSLYEKRECEIKVSVLGQKIEKTIKIIQLPLCPDENHPHMIDLGLSSGTKWSCCNAGASSPEKMGNYYSWGNHSPLSYTTGSYFDKDYPYKEWRDLDHDGKPSSTWDEWFIKLDEAYNSATSGSWGNGSMPSTDDYQELIDGCKRNDYIGTLGNQSGYFYTSKTNSNTIFIPYNSEKYYWTYSSKNNWAWFFNPSSGGSGGSWGDPESLFNIRSQYCTGRQVRPVSK